MRAMVGVPIAGLGPHGVSPAGPRQVKPWESPQPHSCLTGREQQIVQFVAHGWSAKEIARRLGIAPSGTSRMFA